MLRKYFLTAIKYEHDNRALFDDFDLDSDFDFDLLHEIYVQIAIQIQIVFALPFFCESPPTAVKARNDCA